MSNTSDNFSKIETALKAEAAIIESWLASCLLREDVPDGLKEAMRYSLLAGGKRIRPVLCVWAARLCGFEGMAILPFAGALECIHTYSLIHDDLPALDNDDLRRGVATNHKHFDEATAILAGDALLTDAFAYMTWSGDMGIRPEHLLKAIRLIAESAGSPGMVGGQFLDIAYTDRKDINLEALAAMHSMKTGVMLRAACMSGAILAGADENTLKMVSDYGTALGTAFQIVDDILDETGNEKKLGKAVGRDKALNKNTYPALVGLQRSRELAALKVTAAAAALVPCKNAAADLLQGLAYYVLNRVS